MGSDDHSSKVPQLLLSVRCLACNLSMTLGHKVMLLGVHGQLLPVEQAEIAVGEEITYWLLELNVFLGLDPAVMHQSRLLMFNTMLLDP